MKKNPISMKTAVNAADQAFYISTEGGGMNTLFSVTPLYTWGIDQRDEAKIAMDIEKIIFVVTMLEGEFSREEQKEVRAILLAHFQDPTSSYHKGEMTWKEFAQMFLGTIKEVKAAENKNPNKKSVDYIMSFFKNKKEDKQ